MPKLDLIEVRFNAETPPRHPRRAGAPTASTATDPGGKPSQTAWTETRGGRSAWPATQPCSRRADGTAPFDQ